MPTEASKFLKVVTDCKAGIVAGRDVSIDFDSNVVLLAKIWLAWPTLPESIVYQMGAMFGHGTLECIMSNIQHTLDWQSAPWLKR